MSIEHPPVAPWRRWSGYGVVALLAVVLFAISFRRPDPATPLPGAITSRSSPVVSTFPVRATGSAAPATAGADETADTAEVESTVGQALTAWGAFAVSGDLAVMQSWFWADGPQWSNLSADAVSIEERQDDGPLYVVTIDRPVVEVHEDSASLAAKVVFERPGEENQEFSWTLLLRRRNGEWRIWSIEPSDPAG